MNDKVKNNQNTQPKPAKYCVMCHKTIEEVGGRRLIAQKLRGITLAKKHQSGGNKDYPYQSFKLDAESELYLVVWGEQSKWTKPAIAQALKDYQQGNRPWFCQKCGCRVCSTCGEPINYPMGSDTLSDNGCSSHIPIFPIEPGCINKKCGKYKVWNMQ